jgi:hypothetical protein
MLASLATLVSLPKVGVGVLTALSHDERNLRQLGGS